MTLQQLKYMLAVAESGSISEAAKSLFISQPSLSNALKELETEIRRTLFMRTNRGIQLTNDGAEFMRSEERRVGKECRSRWSPYH